MARCSREGWTDTRLGGVWAKVGVLCRSEYVSTPKRLNRTTFHLSSHSGSRWCEGENWDCWKDLAFAKSLTEGRNGGNISSFKKHFSLHSIRVCVLGVIGFCQYLLGSPCSLYRDARTNILDCGYSRIEVVLYSLMWPGDQQRATSTISTNPVLKERVNEYMEKQSCPRP